ncbi:HAD family hydrolase [Bariatricus sp. SGI.154]|uniref:HAD family hydrolase n=1 Tax=Bariatricus sp. SGI.154 TaxID=3420549 RepID=UPI003D046452
MLQTKMLKDIDAIIFDMDGTLIDSMWIWPSIDDDYLAKYNLVKTEDFHEAMEGMSYTEVAQFFLDTYSELNCTREEVMEEWMDMAHDKYMNQVYLKDGVYEFITEMRRQGMKIGIATSNARSLADDTLEALKITELFDVVRSACEVAAGKPSPDVYLLVAEEMGVDPKRCLVFEDVPMGILAGKNAGMSVCAVEDDFSKPQEEKKRALADYYIQNYDDIKNETYEVL